MSSEETRAPKPPPDPFYTLRPHAGDVTAVQYLNLGTNGAIASGTGKGQLSLWSLSSKRQLWTEPCSTGITSISRLEHSDSLSVQLRGGVVALWSLETQKQTSFFTIQNPGFCRLSHFTSSEKGGSSGAFSPSCFVVADSNYGRVNIYDCSTQSLVQTLSTENAKSKGETRISLQNKLPVPGFILPTVPGLQYVMAGFDDGSVVLWECRQPTAELTSLKLFSEPVMCLAFDAKQLTGVCGSPTNSLEAFTLSEEEYVLEKKYSVELKNAGVADVSIRQDSKIIASGGWDGRVRVFGWKKGKPLAILNYHSAVVHCVSFAGEKAQLEDSNLMICGSKDERISLWKIY